MLKQYQAKIRLFACLLISLLSRPALAGVYGAGPYGAGKYSQGFVQIGPITLPATGPQLLAIVSAALIAIAAGWFVRLRQKRRLRTEN